MQPVKILYINGGIMDRGGITAYMMNYYRHIDRTKIQIDFVVHGFEKGIFDDEIKQLGGKIYNIPIKSKNYFGNISALRAIFKTGKYKVVHSHMDAMNAVVLREAKKSNIPIRIAHSHCTEHYTTNKIKFFINEYARKNVPKYTTHFFACSEPAGRWLFGDELTDSGMVKLVRNAIDLHKYTFNGSLRTKIKKDLNLENNWVIGHIGRFDYQKNHSYLLEVFKGLLATRPEARLVLVGDGFLKQKIVQKIEDLNLSDYVILTGARDDVNMILNAFDVFILPSHFEGLGIVLVEAQANGLKCLASKAVPTEVNITGNVKFLPLGDSDEQNWIESLISIKGNEVERDIEYEKFVKAHYSIQNEAKELQKLYLKYIEEL